MLSNDYNSCADTMQYSTGESVIKVGRSCCLQREANILYENKLRNDIQLTQKNYMSTEQENSSLNLQIGELDSRLKVQDYQHACLKYELEQIVRQKCEITCKLKLEFVPQIDKQLEVIDSSRIQAVRKRKSSSSSCHGQDLEKLPETFCLCGVQLKSDQILKDHIRYHNSKAKFICKMCGVKANGLNLLKHHMKKRHDINYLSSAKGCRTCGNLFNTLEQLHDHRRREHGGRKRQEDGSVNKIKNVKSI